MPVIAIGVYMVDNEPCIHI